ncbi:hypothetical protein ACFXOD_11670 [Streptomyces sp. NPDC059161]|uniref:hypothetical protein n=1 Tax=Streptomyces sp. NPDC059161 TaxID=3346749 RepID=UPI0036A5F297
MNPIIVSAYTLAVYISGEIVTSLRGRKAGRAAAKKQACEAAHELQCAALDFKAALTMWEARWRNPWQALHAWSHAMTHVLAGYTDGRLFRGAADGVGTAMAWRRSFEDAEEAIVTGPLSHVHAAAVRVSMLDDAELRAAATAVADAAQELGASYTKKANSAGRARADKEFVEAVAELTDAARSYGGQPRQPWMLRRSRVK